MDAHTNAAAAAKHGDTDHAHTSNNHNLQLSTSFHQFDPVTKASRLTHDLEWFPPFHDLDSSMIKELPKELRHELANIYKLKRSREKKQTTENGNNTGNNNDGGNNHTLSIPTNREPVNTAAQTMIAPTRPAPAVPPPPPPPPRVDASVHRSVQPVTSRPFPPRPAAAPAPVSSHAADDIEWSQIDRSVLDELPASIQSELRAAHLRKQHAQVVTLIGTKRARDSHGGVGGVGQTVKVLNIAAHFKQIEKRQKRQAEAEALAIAEANARKTRVNTNNDATKNKSTPSLPPPLPPPPVPIPPSLPPPLATAHVRPAGVSVTAVPVTDSSPIVPRRVVSPIPESSLVSPLVLHTKGFVRVDPRLNPERYAAAAAAATGNAPIDERQRVPVFPLHSPPLTSALPIHEPPAATSIDIPHCPPPPPVAADADVDDGGVRAMDIDSQTNEKPIKIEIEEKVEEEEEAESHMRNRYESSIEGDERQSDRQPQANNQVIRTKESDFAHPPQSHGIHQSVDICIGPSLAPFVPSADPPISVAPPVSAPLAAVDSAVPVVVDAIGVSDAAVDGDIAVGDGDGNGVDFINFETFEEIRSDLHRWMLQQEIDHDDDDGGSISLLVDYCQRQLRLHRNLELVFDLLRHIRLVASGDWRLLDDRERRVGLTWQRRFNHLLSAVQACMIEVVGGRLGIEPFQTNTTTHPAHHTLIDAVDDDPA